MPFDATPCDVIADDRAVRGIDSILRFFGPAGENWCQGFEYNHVTGNRCLWGAVSSTKLRFAALPYILEAIATLVTSNLGSAQQRIIGFNDANGYHNIRRVLLLAREMAKGS